MPQRWEGLLSRSPTHNSFLTGRVYGFAVPQDFGNERDDLSPFSLLRL